MTESTVAWNLEHGTWNLEKASSSNGRAPDSKSGGWGFKSLLACHVKAGWPFAIPEGKFSAAVRCDQIHLAAISDLTVIRCLGLHWDCPPKPENGCESIPPGFDGGEREEQKDDDEGTMAADSSIFKRGQN